MFDHSYTPGLLVSINKRTRTDTGSVLDHRCHIETLLFLLFTGNISGIYHSVPLTKIQYNFSIDFGIIAEIRYVTSVTCFIMIIFTTKQLLKSKYPSAEVNAGYKLTTQWLHDYVPSLCFFI